jgi:hypothetical protein
MTGPSKPAPKDPRQERLAQALRENLKRRKAQLRGRAVQPDSQDEEPSGKVSGQKG